MNRLRTSLFLALLACSSLVNAATLYVAQDGQTPEAGPPAYTNWNVAASNIQDAVDAAASGDVILVGEGIYTSAASYVVFIENKELELVGVGGRDKVIINGQNARRGIFARMTSRHGDFRFDGFTITNGATTGLGGGIYTRWLGTNTGKFTIVNSMIIDCQAEGGGGMHFEQNVPLCSLFVSNCVFRGNQALNVEDGGGLIVPSKGGAVTIVDSQFLDNYAEDQGGGIYATTVMLDLRSTLIAGNESGKHGGGLLVGSGSSSLVQNCTIRDNLAGSYGGGIYDSGTEMRLRNTLIAGNQGHRSGAIRQVGGDLSVENCTIVGNLGSVGGGSGGIHVDVGTCTVTNSIVYYNRLGGGSSTADNMSGTYTMVHSCSTRPSPPAGAENIEVEPGFVDAGSNFGMNHVAGNYRLHKDAPCINAGTNVAWTATAVDLDGNPRRDRSFGIVDMGAYEYMYTGTLISVQ